MDISTNTPEDGGDGLDDDDDDEEHDGAQQGHAHDLGDHDAHASGEEDEGHDVDVHDEEDEAEGHDVASLVSRAAVAGRYAVGHRGFILSNLMRSLDSEGTAWPGSSTDSAEDANQGGLASSQDDEDGSLVRTLLRASGVGSGSYQQRHVGAGLSTPSANPASPYHPHGVDVDDDSLSTTAQLGRTPHMRGMGRPGFGRGSIFGVPGSERSVSRSGALDHRQSHGTAPGTPAERGIVDFTGASGRHDHLGDEDEDGDDDEDDFLFGLGSGASACSSLMDSVRHPGADNNGLRFAHVYAPTAVPGAHGRMLQSLIESEGTVSGVSHASRATALSVASRQPPLRAATSHPATVRSANSTLSAATGADQRSVNRDTAVFAAVADSRSRPLSAYTRTTAALSLIHI